MSAVDKASRNSTVHMQKPKMQVETVPIFAQGAWRRSKPPWGPKPEKVSWLREHGERNRVNERRR